VVTSKHDCSPFHRIAAQRSGRGRLDSAGPL